MLWWLGDFPELNGASRAAIANTENVCFISAATIWEIEIKRQLGKLAVPDGYSDVLTRQGFLQLAFNWRHALTVAGLPPHHRDPFDRLLIAQAIADDLTLVSADIHIEAYEVRVLSGS